MCDIDDDDIMRDRTPEEMTEGINQSIKYVSKKFLEPKHYQKIHKSLSSAWDSVHSLSAAIELMETYGVTLEEEEKQRLQGLDEATQIKVLVSKMPQHSEQLQQFFLQLQLLVSTAMRVRRSLEEGRTDEVESALDDADTTGIAKYIMRVAIVQAGGEVATLKNQINGWAAEADSKMGRLIRGQQDNLTAQKTLAVAKAELARQNGEQNAKTAKAVISFANGNDKAALLMIYQAWQTAAKQLRIEAQLHEEYAERLKDLEDNMTKWKMAQVSRTENVMLRQIQQEQQALLGRIFDIWRKEMEDAKFVKEHGEQLRELEEKLENTKASQKESATKVLSGMASASEQGLKELAIKGWIQVRRDTIKQKELQEARLNGQSKLDQFTKGKSEEAKFFVKNVAGASNTGLLHQCMTSWIQLNDEKKKEAEIAEAMYKSQNKMKSFQQHNKATSGSVMNRAGQHVENLLLLRCFCSWRMDAKMEHSVRYYHLRLDAKSGQLTNVQQMFRKFAEQLESGMSQGKGDPAKDAPKDAAKDAAKDTNRHHGRTSNRGMSKNNQNSVSLPEINKGKPSSGRTGSRPGSQGGRETPTEQPGAGKTAWN